MLLFWRWPKYCQDIARKGIAPMFDSDLPCSLEEQPEHKDQKIRKKVREKLEKVVAKGYIELTDIKFVEAIMYMFHVAKGDNIRMVYDGSKSGLNTAIYAPLFPLLTTESMTRWVTVGSWLADNDYRECFLNFLLHPDLCIYCGVDLTRLFPETCDTKACMVVGVWLRCAMGLCSSPYNVI